jgi:hypothetical protein
MRKLLILVVILSLVSCSMPFGKKKTAQTPEKPTKGERVDSGSEPKPGDIKLVDGVEYIYARNRRYNTVNSEPEYIWYRKDQYSPGLFESVKGSIGSSSDKKERAELESVWQNSKLTPKQKGAGLPANKYRSSMPGSKV